MSVREILLDTETTGLHPAQHRICSIALVELVDAVPTGKFLHFYLDPERDIDPGAEKAHGLSREFLTGKPKFASIAPLLGRFVRDSAHIVAHNAKFDRGFVDTAYGSHGLHPVWRCTYEKAEAVRGRGKGRNTLDTLAREFKVPNLREQTGYHGALIDCLVLANVYRALRGLPIIEIDPSPYLDYLRAQAKPTPRSAGTDPEAQAPVTAGHTADGGPGVRGTEALAQ